MLLLVIGLSLLILISVNFRKESLGRIVGLELNFTDNSFGDKDPRSNRVVDPFGTGATDGGSSRFTTNFTSDLTGDGDIDGQPLDPGFKQVPLTAETSSPDFKLVPIDAQVIDSTQKAVPADAIVVSVDVPENTTVESNELQVESDDIQQPDTTNELRLLSANEIAVPADSVIVGPDQIAVPADSVVLSPDQIAVSADAEVLEEGQRAIPEQKVDVDTEFTDSTAGDSQSTGDYQQPPSISSPQGLQV